MATEPGNKEMSVEMQTGLATPENSGGCSLPRFPAGWAVQNPDAERLFARWLWLLVPLQYYVLINMRGGLSIDDVMPSVALSLISVVVIFVVSFIAANVVAFWEPPRVEGDTINSRVRMWVVSLMIGTAAAYFLFALSLAITHYAVAYRGADLYGDLITDSIIRLLGGLGVSADKIDSLGLILQSISNVTYVFLALLLIFFAHRLLRRKIVDVREPNILTVGIIVTIVMTVTNWIAMMD